MLDRPSSKNGPHSFLLLVSSYITCLLSSPYELLFSTSVCDAELGLAESEVSLNSWTWVFSLVAVVLAFFLLCLQALAACDCCMALLWCLWRNDSNCLVWLEMCRPHKVPGDLTPKDHRPQCMLLMLPSLCHREGCVTDTQSPHSLPSRSLLSSKPVCLSAFHFSEYEEMLPLLRNMCQAPGLCCVAMWCRGQQSDCKQRGRERNRITYSL